MRITRTASAGMPYISGGAAIRSSWSSQEYAGVPGDLGSALELVRVRRSSPESVGVRKSLREFVGVLQSLLDYSRVHWCSNGGLEVLCSSLEFSGTPWSFLEFHGVQGVHGNLLEFLEFPGVSWSSPEYTGVGNSNSEFFGVAWSPPE